MKGMTAITLAVLGMVTAFGEMAGLYDYPATFTQYTQLRIALMQSVRAGDIKTMEAICRKGLELMPGDATWQYNLACALAYREKPDLAIEALDKAVKAGFRDAKAIAADNDLKRIAGDARFQAILEEARKTADIPVAGEPIKRNARIAPGTKVVLNRANLAWDFDRGMYVALFTFAKGNRESGEVQAAQYAGPAKELLASWLADGNATGSVGDIYVNRDHDHSRVKIADFPMLTELRMELEARNKNVDTAVPNMLYPGAAVVGNASLAIVTTNESRSLMRAVTGNLYDILKLQQCYSDNQFWVFPAHKDYATNGVDRYSGVTPVALQSVGSSGSDRYFVRAALAASAAMKPETKAAVLERKLFGPTMQWLFRRTRRGVNTEDDYLSPKAHPPAFDREGLDEVRMVEMAHALSVENLPPAVMPFSLFVPITKTDLEKELDFQFSAIPKAPNAEYAWRVVHGDEKRVKITPNGGGKVHFSVDCRNLIGRIDIACFARCGKSEYGAPSFVSVYRPEKPKMTETKKGGK